MTAPMCVNDPDQAAAVVTVHGGDQLGEALCTGCATCTDLPCAEPGVVLDAETRDPWCAEHAATHPGPELVPLDSARHRALAARDR